MKELINFQIKRLKNKYILILLPCLLIAIGILGLFLSEIFYGSDATAKVKIMSVYNSYTQFIFLFLIYVFISTFSDDFSSGTYAFMKQIGYQLYECVLSKAIAVYGICFIGTNLIIFAVNFINGNTDYTYLFAILLSVNLSIIFVILFAIILSLIVKKTMTATLIAYGSFLIMNILNSIGFGLTNPADGNSISAAAIQILAGHGLNHYSLSKITLDFEKYSFQLATAPVLIWVLILAVVSILIMKKENKKNEI